ncbi:MAG: hypothetical protein LBS50_10480 [Prevotellaceae bacterium]|nr:hypothetical protein [Prevotellaceae bacterium]
MKKLFAIITISLLISCAENDRQKAEKLFNKAEQFYKENNTAQAAALIDSIHAAFPRQVEFRRKADTVSWKITLDKIRVELPLNDSALMSECTEAEAVAKNFNFVKNEKYQQSGNYEPREVSFTALRNCLKPATDEKGNFFFISTFVGQPLNYRAVEAVANGLSAQTQTAAESNCNSYNEIGTTCETVIFNAENAKDFILFLLDNENNSLKINLLGDKNFSYTLAQRELKAFVETFKFSLLLKGIAQRQQQKAEMEQTAHKLQLRLEKS